MINQETSTINGRTLVKTYSDSGKYVIQNETGKNNNSKTFQVWDYQLLDGNTGKIPAERLDLSSITPTMQTLTINNGVVNNTVQTIEYDGSSAQTLDMPNLDLAVQTISGIYYTGIEFNNMLSTVVSSASVRRRSTSLLFDTRYFDIRRGSHGGYEYLSVRLAKDYVETSTTVAGKPLSSNVTLGNLTIKRNGSDLGDYNGEENKEINISVPTSTSDLTNDGDGTKVNGNVDPYAKVSQIPTNNNQLTNGAGYTKVTVNNVAQTTLDFDSDPQDQINSKENKLITTKTTDILFKNLTPFSWEDKVWTGLDSFSGEDIWTDGIDIYYSSGTNQKVLNKTTSIWEDKTWSGLTDLDAQYIWSDGNNVYYSYSSQQYILNRATSTWEIKTWNGNYPRYAYDIWTDGVDIYYSSISDQYILNKETSTWETKTWNGIENLGSEGLQGEYIWTDGENIYYSNGSKYQLVLDKSTSTWEDKIWNGNNPNKGYNVWSDGKNIYFDIYNAHYILDKKTSTFNKRTWNGITNFYGEHIWTDGINIYYSSGTTHKILIGTDGNIPQNALTLFRHIIRITNDIGSDISYTMYFSIYSNSESKIGDTEFQEYLYNNNLRNSTNILPCDSGISTYGSDRVVLGVYSSAVDNLYYAISTGSSSQSVNITDLYIIRDNVFQII